MGFEVFDGADPAAADAEVFATILGALDLPGAVPVTGDIGLLRAALSGIEISERRRGALFRHLWRPRRFRALLDRFSSDAPARALPEDLPEVPLVGKRSAVEIEARLEALRADAEEPPLSADQRGLIDRLLNLKEALPFVIDALRDLAVDLPAIGPAVDGLARRAEALSARGIDIDGLAFEGSYGRTSMEYYDGFVFGISAPQSPDLPPIATGGRYDALTRMLGGRGAVPAVGGVVRPEGLLAARGGA